MSSSEKGKLSVSKSPHASNAIAGSSLGLAGGAGSAGGAGYAPAGFAVGFALDASGNLTLSPTTTTTTFHASATAGASGSGTAAMSTQSFAPNERVLCYHGPLFYEAKVLKPLGPNEPSPTGEEGPHYRVHYKGWKSTWDEWVPVRRLMKYSDEKVLLQKKAAAEQKAEASAAAAAAKEKSASSKMAASASAASRGGMSGSGTLSALSRKEGARGTKRARDDDDGQRRPEMRYDIPDILKVQLVDDWEFITHDSQLVPLPRKPSVADTLAEFSKWAAQQPHHQRLPRATQLLPTVTAGLKLYFDRALGQQLLYRFERRQYAEMRKEYVTGSKVGIGMQKTMSEIYGSEHLLRMLVNLPGMVSQTKMDPDSVNILTDYVVWLLKYMVLEREKLFVRQYEATTNEYRNVMLNT